MLRYLWYKKRAQNDFNKKCTNNLIQFSKTKQSNICLM